MKEIKIINLTKAFSKNYVITNLNYIIRPNRCYFLTSLNGTGKTTLFNCLLKETSYQGKIIDFDIKYTYLPDKIKFPFFLSSLDFIKLLLKINQKNLDETKILNLFEEFNITKYIKKDVNKLSKGTKQKLLLIKTLLAESDCYLFDEPLSGLDCKSRIIFIKHLNELLKKEKLIIIATHYFNEYTLEFPKEIIKW